MNQINLIGRITKDPELKFTQNNKAVCEFDIAVNRIGQEQTDFITCVVWEKQAENLVKYQSKGSLIAVNGALRVDKYQNQEGQNRYKTYVLAINIEYLNTKTSENVNKQSDTQAPQNETPVADPFEEMGVQVRAEDYPNMELPF